MKKTYNKLDSELLLVETEGGFMGSSVLIKKSVTVEDYAEYQWIDDPKVGDDVVNGTWNVKFD